MEDGEAKLYWRRNIPLQKKNSSVLIAGRKRLTRDWIKRIVIYKVLLSVSVFPLHSPYFFLNFCVFSPPSVRGELVFSCLDLTWVNVAPAVSSRRGKNPQTFIQLSIRESNVAPGPTSVQT